MVAPVGPFWTITSVLSRIYRLAPFGGGSLGSWDQRARERLQSLDAGGRLLVQGLSTVNGSGCLEGYSTVFAAGERGHGFIH